MKSLGVDIGSSSIKIAEIEGSGRNVAITQFWEIGLSLDPMKDPSIEILERLREFTSQYPDKDAKWVIAVPQNAVSVRLKRFPFQQRGKVLKSLPFELEEEIPFDTAETIFDTRVVETFPNGSDVLAVASPEEPIGEIIERAKDGGIDADIVSTEGFALSNVMDAWWAPPPSSNMPAAMGDDAVRTTELHAANAILQIGHQRSIIVVYRDGRPVAIRSIQWGGHDVALAIESVFKVPYVEAIKVLRTKSFVLLNTNGASRDQLAMHKAIADSTTGFIRELRMTLLDLKTSSNVDVRDIRLTGGASQIQNFAPWLTQSVEVPVNNLEYFGALASTGRVQVRVSLTPQLESIAGTAIGLALEGLRKPNNPAINLRKGMFAASNESVKLFWDRWSRTIQVAAAIFVAFFAYSLVRESMSLTLAEKSEEVLQNAAKTSAGLKGAQISAEGVTRYIDAETKAITNRETLASLENFVPAMDFVLRLAERLPVQLPPREGRGLNVDRLFIENEELVVEGRVLGADLLPLVEKELQLIAKPGSVKKVAATSIRSGAPGTPFGFAMKINRKP